MIEIPINCTGCTACISVCPKSCISESTDHEGFMIPVIKPDDCIDCGLCERVCPALNKATHNGDPMIYVGQCADDLILNNSSSGGIFSLIASSILDNGGVIYGAAIDYADNCKVKHIKISDSGKLYKLRGSKYVQSALGNTFKSVKSDLVSGSQVLFSGTPCQVAGLKKFLRKDYENLLTIDVICHGVPSPLVWDKYIKYELDNFVRLHNNPDISVNSISFRDKRSGWQNFGFAISFAETIDPENKNETTHFYNRYENPYMKGFLFDLYLRESCYNCPVKSFTSKADITLADAWGIGNFIENPAIDRGFSLIMPISEKGKRAIDRLPLSLTKVPGSILEKHNPSAFHSPERHRKRNKFFSLIQRGTSMPKAIEICLPEPSYIRKVIWSINQRLKKIWNR